jgi:hypothetical protein
MRGGKRNGTKGNSYSNRTDLAKPKALPITTVPGQAYGKATEQANAQRAVPMASGPMTAAPVASAPRPSAPIQPLFAPTSRPDEPVSAGAPWGEGPNDVSTLPANPIQEKDPAVEMIRALYMTDPRNEDLRMIVQELDQQGRIR